MGSVGRMGRVGKREHHLTAWQCSLSVTSLSSLSSFSSLGSLVIFGTRETRETRVTRESLIQKVEDF